MKKVTLTLVLIFMCLVALAQDPDNPAYLALNKFVGTWVYNKDGKEVKIILNKVKQQVNHENVYIYVINGYHVYKVNGKKIEDYQERNKISLAMGYIELRDRPNVLVITVSDSIKNKAGEARLTFIPGNPDKLRWDLINRETFISHKKGEPDYDSTFTLPEYMVLTKEN